MTVQKLNNHEFSVEFTPEDLEEYGVEVCKMSTDPDVKESVLQLTLQTVLETFDIESPYPSVREILSIDATTQNVVVIVTFPGDVITGSDENTVVKNDAIYLLLQNLEDGTCLYNTSNNTRLLRTSVGVYVLEVICTDYEEAYTSFCEGFEIVEKPTNYSVIIEKDAAAKLKLMCC